MYQMNGVTDASQNLKSWILAYSKCLVRGKAAFTLHPIIRSVQE